MVRGKSTRGTQGQPRGQLAVRTARGEACGVVWRWPGADLGTCVVAFVESYSAEHEGAGKGCQRAATAASGRGGDTCAAVPRDAFGSGVKERSVAAAVRVIESQRRAAAQRCGVRVSAAWREVGRRASSSLGFGFDVGWPLGCSKVHAR